MKNRSRNVLVALLAAGVLVLGGLSGVAAHGPRFPGTSAKPLPSGWVWPSDLKTPPVKSHQPDPSKKPDPSKPPKVTPPPFSCATTTTPTPTPTPTATASSAVDAANAGKNKLVASWEKQVRAFRDNLNVQLQKANADKQKALCNVTSLRKVLDAQIAGRIRTFQDSANQVGKSGLGASDVAVVDGELNNLIADLQAFKTKVDGETTLAALQADYQTLAGHASMYRTVQLWIQDLVGAEKVIAAGPGLITLENKIAAEIAVAPAVPETADAQIFLDNMKLAVTAGEAKAAPLPATLLAITPAQLADGSAKATLTSAKVNVLLAGWYIRIAHMTGDWAEHELKEATTPPKATATPTATPKATATPTATPTATATPMATPTATATPT
jgi:hypothetical protein